MKKIKNLYICASVLMISSSLYSVVPFTKEELDNLSKGIMHTPRERSNSQLKQEVDKINALKKEAEKKQQKKSD